MGQGQGLSRLPSGLLPETRPLRSHPLGRLAERESRVRDQFCVLSSRTAPGQPGVLRGLPKH